MKNKAAKFQQLHLSTDTFFLASAWNAGNAGKGKFRIFESANSRRRVMQAFFKSLSY